MKTQTTVLEKITTLPLNFVLPILAFAIPLFISGPQWLTGTVVNTLLFLVVSQNLGRKNWLSVAILPSLAAVSHGLLFGKFTPFLLYFLPFIWIGNLLLMFTFFKLNKFLPLTISVIFSSLIKSFWLYLFASIFFQLKLVPSVFLTSMGIFQLVTAVFGGIIATRLVNSKLSLRTRA